MFLLSSAEMETVFQDPIVISADYQSICEPEDPDLMLLVVLIEVILLIALASKLIYDVLQYNKTGELPWIAKFLWIEGHLEARNTR